jgi:hypothetical protein
MCRVVDTWVGQGGKVSLANSADADILEYILAKLVARIVAKSRTFLVKVKTHRGDPLNEVETPLDDHEKILGNDWWHTFGPSNNLLQLLGKGISVRTSRTPQGG